MKNKYVTPEISVAQLEKKDILSTSDMDNKTYGAANKKSVDDLIRSIVEDFGFI